MVDLLQIDENHVYWNGRVLPCVIGMSGFARDKVEGDFCTPHGKWKLLKVYYRADKVGTPKSKLPIVAISPNLGWSDDPNDHLYNKPIKLPYAFSHEKLWREDDLYDLLITTDHNTNPVVRGKGSAIFIHQMRENETPTAGCLALRKTDLEHLVATIDCNTYWDTGAGFA